MISPQQIKIIHTLKNKLHLSDEDYVDMLTANFKTNSSKKLSFTQARSLISKLTDICIKQGLYKPAKKTPPPGMSTGKQQYMLLQLWRTVSVLPIKDQRTGFNKFLRNRFRIGCLEWLPKNMVGKVRHTLLAMQKQGG